MARKKKLMTISFLPDDETMQALKIVEATIDTLPSMRRSAAIRKAIRIAAAQITQGASR
jgi:hypothetical protein